MGKYPIPGLGGGVPHLRSRWGVPHLRSGGGTPSRSGGWGVPHHRSGGWGVPRVPPNQVWMVGGYPGYPPPMRQSSIASTCYAADGVPLAFTQEDFLVMNLFPFDSSSGRSIFCTINCGNTNFEVYFRIFSKAVDTSDIFLNISGEFVT